MRICPFISHMLGEENINTLTIDSTSVKRKSRSQVSGSDRSDEVVILGYDGGAPGGVQVQTATPRETKSESESGPSLFCLKEPCRFYKKDSGQCAFDQIHSMLQDSSKSGEPKTKIQDKHAARVVKELEKFWKFQTRSVAELIAGIGESEKKYSEALAKFKKDICKDLKNVANKGGKTELQSLRKSIEAMNKSLAEREEGIENFSTTLSELVLNLEDRLSELQAKTQSLTEGLQEVKAALPREEKMGAIVKKLLAKEKGGHKPDLPDRISSLEKKFLDAFDSYGKTEAKMASWHEGLEKKIDELKRQQHLWEERLGQIANGQSELLQFFKEDKKWHETEKRRFDKKEAKKFNNLGVTSFHNGAFDAARDQFLEALKRDPDFAEAYNNLGLAYTELREEEKATEAFTRAVQLKPDLPAAYNNLGYIFYKQGSYEQAIDMYNEALGRSANNSPAYTNLGNAYYKLGKIEEARDAWRKALEIDPGNEKAERNLKRVEQKRD